MIFQYINTQFKSYFIIHMVYVKYNKITLRYKKLLQEFFKIKREIPGLIFSISVLTNQASFIEKLLNNIINDICL